MVAAGSRRCSEERRKRATQQPSDDAGQEDHKERHKPAAKRCKQDREQHQPQRETDYHLVTPCSFSADDEQEGE